ncbi:MAG: outer membrane beta-barrel domain-containing protein [Deltaproteobacteria bacterium]|nr:outer membrane beta-barrel domain-containing protein [Deltaproteobacteria bacterium]
MVAVLGLSASALMVTPRESFAEESTARNAAQMEAAARPAMQTEATIGSRAPAAAPARDDVSDNEYNFSWLDPDKKVYVLQNRKYRKARKFGIFLSGGVNLTNPFKTEFAGLPRAAFWFSEQIGIELFYARLSNSDNDTFSALKKVSASALPFVREHRDYYGAVLSWVPWYSKLNFFNRILYFDWSLNGGVGQVKTAVDQNNKAAGPVNYQEEAFTAFFFGTAQNFFLSRDWSVRLDLVGMAYRAKGADNATLRTFTNFDFTAGVGYLF